MLQWVNELKRQQEYARRESQDQAAEATGAQAVERATAAERGLAVAAEQATAAKQGLMAVKVHLTKIEAVL